MVQPEKGTSDKLSYWGRKMQIADILEAIADFRAKYMSTDVTDKDLDDLRALVIDLEFEVRDEQKRRKNACK